MYSSGSREAEFPHWSHCSGCRWVEQMHQRMHSESSWVRTAWQRESASIMRINAVVTRVDLPMDCKPKWTGLSRNWDLVMHISIYDLKEEQEKRHSPQHKGHNSWPLPWGKTTSDLIISLPNARHRAFPANVFSSMIASGPPSNLLLILSSHSLRRMEVCLCVGTLQEEVPAEQREGVNKGAFHVAEDAANDF